MRSRYVELFDEESVNSNRLTWIMISFIWNVWSKYHCTFVWNKKKMNEINMSHIIFALFVNKLNTFEKYNKLNKSIISIFNKLNAKNNQFLTWISYTTYIVVDGIYTKCMYFDSMLLRTWCFCMVYCHWNYISDLNSLPAKKNLFELGCNRLCFYAVFCVSESAIG